MLVLSRKRDEEIVIGGNVRIVVIRLQGGCVKLGIDAPRDVSVHRGEVQRDVDAGLTPELIEELEAAHAEERMA